MDDGGARVDQAGGTQVTGSGFQQMLAPSKASAGFLNGDLRFTHSGLLDTYSSFSVIFPADRSSVVVLCNFVSNGLPNFVIGPGGIRSIMAGS